MITRSSTSWYNKPTALSPSRARRTMPASRSDIDERTRSRLSPMRPAAVPGMAPRGQSQSAPLRRLPSARNPEGIVSENLFRGAGVDHWKSADPGAEIVHFCSIEGPACLPEPFFQSGDYGIAEQSPPYVCRPLG